ncbi:uncharacterized protein AB675_3600 [Cyphellophora attinorum]|uniref:Condensation domain-containing protein n=1 Tax=Cyphellophora attinorum TaxID=1664694 RepID=A0A0N0NJM8_9EURO|nr:uncharacterized protein AB675_3600 [Phialophora attinorum]KPI37078.1 hypothetical protein AB675_3600 [Phialophora attinorum]
MPLSTGYTSSPDKPSLFSRPLSDTETPFVYAITAPRPFIREPVRIHIFADVAIPESPTSATSALRMAWKALRLLHEPDIATTFDPATMEKVYEVEDEAGVECWLKRTFMVAAQGESVEEVVRREKSRTEHMPVCHVIPKPSYAPAAAEPPTLNATILLLFSHWRTEASGVYMLLNRLLLLAGDILSSSHSKTTLALQSHTPGDEISLLTPPPEDMACPVPDKSVSDNEAIRRTVHTRFESHRLKLPSIEVPSTNPATHPTGSVQVHRVVFSQADTSKVIAACKAASPNVSVTATCLAAYLLSIWPLLPKNRDSWFASMMPAQMRTRLSAEGTEMYKAMGCWNAAQMLLLSSPPPTAATSSGSKQLTFLERTRELHAQAAIANRPQWLLEMRELSKQSAAFWASIPAGSGAAPWFTSLGDLERGGLLQQTYDIRSCEAHEATQIKLEQIYGWADPVGMGIVLTVWTFRGKMNWQIQWNDAYHERAIVAGILNAMTDEIAKGLPNLQEALVPIEVVENLY